MKNYRETNIELETMVNLEYALYFLSRGYVATILFYLLNETFSGNTTVKIVSIGLTALVDW